MVQLFADMYIAAVDVAKMIHLFYRTKNKINIEILLVRKSFTQLILGTLIKIPLAL